MTTQHPPAKRNPKRGPKKFSGHSKLTLSALSLLGLIGGWNLIANLENSQINNVSAAQQSPTATLQAPARVINLSGKLPAIAPLPTLPPVPTLRPFTNTASPTVAAQPVNIEMPDGNVAQIVPLPTLAPLPPMPDLPSPPPIPAAPRSAWNQTHSGGS